jgi:hypothetical protein
MKRPRISLGTVGFLVSLCAVNFAVIRGAIFADGPGDGTVFGFLLLPMMNLMLAAAYRLRRPERRTPRALGFMIVGCIASALAFGALVTNNQLVFDMLIRFGRPLARSTDGLLRRLLAGTPLFVFVEVFMGLAFEIFLPMAYVCALPLLAALLGGWAARRLLPPGPRRTS